MSNTLPILDRVIYTDLSPWNPSGNTSSDEAYKDALHELPTVEITHQPKYLLDFYRPFNYKTQYYAKLITGEANAYIDRIINLIEGSKTKTLKKYWLNDTLNKKLKTKIQDVGKLINTNDFALQYINPAKTIYSIDTAHKENAYIIQLTKITLIKIYLEIQRHFKPIITDDTLLTIDDFYTRLLFEPIPENYFLKEIPDPIVIEATDNTTTTKKISAPAATIEYNSFTYKHYNTRPDDINDLFDSLKKNNFIASDTNLNDFKKIFSGKAINRPIVWTGTVSDLYYLIKLLYSTNKSVEDLKQHQWEVTCKCFIDANGQTYDRQKFKDYKAPKSTKQKLEQIAALLQA